MKMRGFFFAVCALALVVGCSRNKQEAAKRFNQAVETVKLDPGAAIKLYQEAVELDPTQHKYLYGLAQAYEKKEEWDKVASTMGRAVELAPTFANYWFLRGWAFENIAKKNNDKQAYQDAEEPYNKCIQNDPNHDECYRRLAVISLWLDRPDSEQVALQNYTKAIERRPDRMEYYWWLADLYRRLRYFKEAAEVLSAAKSMAKPGDKEMFNVHQILADLYKQDGKVEQAVEELRAAKDLDAENHPEILFNLGSTLATMGDKHKSEAVAMLKDFCKRGCKAKGAEKYRVQCEQAAELALKFGESCG